MGNVGGASATETHPQQCSALRKDGYVMLKGRPCKITEMSYNSKTDMVTLTAADIFNQEQNYEEICPSTDNRDVPNVSFKKYQVVEIEDGFLSLMDETGDMKEDLKVPSTDGPNGKLGKQIMLKYEHGAQFMVTVMSACGEEQVTGWSVM